MTAEIDRRPAVIIICAPKGEVRAARGIVARGIRRVLGPKAGQEPHCLYYMSKGEMVGYTREYGELDPDPRYRLDVTDEEMDRICRAIHEESTKAGFDRPPMDPYHD